MRAALIVALCLLPSIGFAKNGAYRVTKHGDPVNGVERRNDRPRGSCLQCHDQHAQTNHAGLFAPNDNELCFTCHAVPSSDGVFQGRGGWFRAAHIRQNCVDCHDPHGVKDTTGVIPGMLAGRDSDLCDSCHNGSQTRTDMGNEYQKTYHHPIGPPGRHEPDEHKPADFAHNQRHAECSDCHNAHTIGADSAPPSPPLASSRLAGVSRIQVANGGAGVAPTYLWRAADDPGSANEYEICFKCHSSYTTQPSGQSNLALLTNPANPSYHPIQAEGKNPRIDARAFTNNVNAQSIIGCTDCHSSDDRRIRGPHGSSYQYILKKPSTSSTTRQPMLPTDICFDCHTYEVYANATSSTEAQRSSRFDTHVLHVATKKIPCYGCHETHGSTRRAALIAMRTPGITSFTTTPTGGTCTSSCHTSKVYTVSYSR